MEESERVPGNGRIRFEYRKTVQTSTEKWQNQGQYWKMNGFGQEPGYGRIRAIIEKLFEPVPTNGRIKVSTGK